MKVALANLDIYSSSPRYLAVTPPVLRQFLEAFGRIPRIFYVLFVRTRQVCLQLRGTKRHHASVGGFGTESVTDY